MTQNDEVFFLLPWILLEIENECKKGLIWWKFSNPLYIFLLSLKNKNTCHTIKNIYFSVNTLIDDDLLILRKFARSHFYFKLCHGVKNHFLETLNLIQLYLFLKDLFQTVKRVFRYHSDATEFLNSKFSCFFCKFIKTTILLISKQTKIIQSNFSLLFVWSGIIWIWSKYYILSYEAKQAIRLDWPPT